MTDSRFKQEMRELDELENRVRWRWFDTLAWLIFAALGVATFVKTGDWVTGLVLVLFYPVVRALAAGNSRAKRNW